MNMLHVKYAVEIANVGSINKASDILLVSQPNLSRAIKQLEKSLGITIFARSSKGMYLTPEGEEFITYAKKILAQIDEVEAIYKSNSQQQKIFSISVPRASYISYAFAQFTKNIDENTKVKIFYKEANSMQIIENIVHAGYKLGVIRYEGIYDKYFKKILDENELIYKVVSSFNYVLLMNEDNPLAKFEKICFSDLQHYIEIVLADRFMPALTADVKNEELNSYISQRIFVFERSSNFDMLSKNNKLFMWSSPVPQKLLNMYQLVQKKCDENKKIYKDVLIYKKGYCLTNLDNAFITELYNAKNAYINI